MIRSGSDCTLINQEDPESPAERFLPSGRTGDVAMLRLGGSGALFSCGESGGAELNSIHNNEPGPGMWAIPHFALCLLPYSA